MERHHRSRSLSATRASLANVAADPRPAAVLDRYHRRTRRRSPWLQAVARPVVALLCWIVSRVRVSGAEHLPKSGAYLLVANHPSVLDHPFVLLPTRRRASFMGKSELFAGLKGMLVSRLGGFPVRRRTWDREAFATAEDLLARGKVLIMYLEGGVSPIGGYRPARPGAGYLAARTGVPVVPCHIAGTRELYRPWRRPRVSIVYGPSLSVARETTPSPQRCQAVSDEILAAVKQLGATG